MSTNNDVIYNTINKYNNLLYDNNGPVSFAEYVSDKCNIVHEQLFNDALQKLLNIILYIINANNKDDKIGMTIDEFKNMYNIIEIKQNEYWQPSKIILSYRNTENNKIKRHTIDLTPYWNTSNYPKNKVSDIKVLGYHDVVDFEIIYIDYMKATATLRSKTRGIEITVPFSSIDGNTPISEDFLLSDTFSYKAQNKIYGR